MRWPDYLLLVVLLVGAIALGMIWLDNAVERALQELDEEERAWKAS